MAACEYRSPRDPSGRGEWEWEWEGWCWSWRGRERSGTGGEYIAVEEQAGQKSRGGKASPVAAGEAEKRREGAS